ncbi:hypothetical protein [Streptomyces sp. NPDC055036]
MSQVLSKQYGEVTGAADPPWTPEPVTSQEIGTRLLEVRGAHRG